MTKPADIMEDGEELWRFPTPVKCGYCHRKGSLWWPHPPRDRIASDLRYADDPSPVDWQCADGDACDRRWFKQNPEKEEEE